MADYDTSSDWLVNTNPDDMSAELFAGSAYTIDHVPPSTWPGQTFIEPAKCFDDYTAAKIASVDTAAQSDPAGAVAPADLAYRKNWRVQER